MVSADGIADKFNQLDEFLSILKSTLKTPLSSFLKDKVLIDSAKYYLQVNIKCCLDIATMLSPRNETAAPKITQTR